MKDVRENSMQCKRTALDASLDADFVHARICYTRIKFGRKCACCLPFPSLTHFLSLCFLFLVSITRFLCLPHSHWTLFFASHRFRTRRAIRNARKSSRSGSTRRVVSPHSDSYLPLSLSRSLSQVWARTRPASRPPDLTGRSHRRD